ncbi:hypothetical protein J6590_065292 [Homalodisca vitripennis]|nr:hypothetical protein J6590_065292 [Homalodisca vitripennis]
MIGQIVYDSIKDIHTNSETATSLKVCLCYFQECVESLYKISRCFVRWFQSYNGTYKQTFAFIYIDFKFSRPISKLEQLGVKGQAHAWFKSYLEGRSQVVEIQDTQKDIRQEVRSDPLPITRGVPQLRFPSSATGLAACYVIKAKCAACFVEAHLNTAQRKSVFLGFVILRSVTRNLNSLLVQFHLLKKCTVFIDMDRRRNVLARFLLRRRGNGRGCRHSCYSSFFSRFLLTRDQFFTLQGLVREEIPVKQYNRVTEPITAEIKLAEAGAGVQEAKEDPDGVVDTEEGAVYLASSKSLTTLKTLLLAIAWFFLSIGDEAFKLDNHVMKPYTHKQAIVDVHKRHFNYATCARRNFFTPINLKPETVELVIFVSYCLHNWIRDDFIARNPKGAATHPQHELPTQNMIPLAYVGVCAKAEGFKFLADHIPKFALFRVILEIGMAHLPYYVIFGDKIN